MTTNLNRRSYYSPNYRWQAQSIFEYHPRINNKLTANLLIKLVSSRQSSLPTIGSVIAKIIESDKIIPIGKRCKTFFICEPIVAGFLIFPILAIFWQSGWNFLITGLDTPLGKHPAILPSLYLLSQLIFFIIYINQDRFYDFLIKQEGKFVVPIILQFHSLITGLNYIIQWVSMWTIWDRYTSDDWFLMLIISVAAIFAMIILTGHPYDLVCAPFILSYDSVEYNIRIETPFVTEKMNQCLSHILNYIFYEYIISILSILAWRGSYTFLDVYLYPNNSNMSAVVSLLIGYPLYFILMYTQCCQSKIDFLSRFIDLNYPSFIQNLRHLCAYISCVLLWRGYWILFDEHFATISFASESPYLFYSICMIISFSVLSIMKTASSISGPMSHISDEYDLFPLYSNCYLVKWFHEKKKSDEVSLSSSQITNVSVYTITVF